MTRGAAAAVLIVAAHAMLVTVLVASAADPAEAWRDLLRAGRDCVIVFDAFAAIRTSTPRVWIVAVAAAATMLTLERLLAREHASRWRALLDANTST